MERKAEAARAKELRGNIIEQLYDLYGEAATLGMLRSLLRYKNYSGDKEIKRAVEYLSEEERRLIKITPSENGAYWDAGVSLTANGVNLAEGDKTDVGVEIDE